MFDIDIFKNFILSNIPSAKLASGGKVINCRCFECPDSSDPRTGHFYFILPKNENESLHYYCHKCNCHGKVTTNKLIEWGIYDESIAKLLIDHYKSKSTEKYITTKKIVNIRNTFITDNEISKIKLDYINNRLGTNFNYRDICNLKIVLNLNDLLNENNISKITRDISVVNALSGNFLGFLSISNSYLNMRRVCDAGLLPEYIDKRYINYKLYENNDGERFYTIPTSIDLLSNFPVNIHIAEGPFDIISIYENVRKREPGIYTSVAGSNYLGIIKYFLINYKIPNIIIHIYPDNDSHGSDNEMKKIANFLKPLNIELFIHRNLFPNEKDFGVSINRIKEGIIKYC